MVNSYLKLFILSAFLNKLHHARILMADGFSIFFLSLNFKVLLILDCNISQQ